MVGDGSSDGVNRDFAVGEGSARLRGPRTRKPRIAVPTWTERPVPSREKNSTDAQVEGSVELRHQSGDAMDASEVDSPAVADALWGNMADSGGIADESTFEARNPMAREGTEVLGVPGWRNPRRHSPRKWVRSARAPVTESSARNGLGRVVELSNNEASGSRDTGVHGHGAVIGFSSDEEDTVVTGKKPVHDVIDLADDSPGPVVNGLVSNGTDEAGPSQSSGESPPRRLMQRPASVDAKRARRLIHRSGVDPPEALTADEDFITPEDPSEIEPPGDDAPPPPPQEPYNLRRGRSLVAAGAAVHRQDRRALSNHNGVRGRLRRQRFPPNGSAGVGFSDLNNLRRPFSVPSSSGNGNTEAQRNPVANLLDPAAGLARRPENTIVLEDDGDPDRARQLAEDERVARELQDSFALEDQPPADEVIARMLQAEENSHGRVLPTEQRPVFLAPAGMRSLLGGDEDEREARRLFRNELAQGQMSDNVASSSRIVRRGNLRNPALSRTLTALTAPPPDVMNARRVQFPARMGLESRMEFLAALEMALEQVPVGLQLAHVDRDFNESDYEMLLALDTDNHRHRGASLESINQLPVTTIAPTDVIDNCSICLETPKAGDALKRLPCMHAFHQLCIDEWLQHRSVCPVCMAHI